MWTAAIIAGGQATRLGGRDKAALLVGGTPILERQLAAVRGLVDHLLIVANDDDRYRHTGVPIVKDVVSGAGSLGGVLTAVSAAPDDRVLVLAADMPFVVRGLLAYLVGRGALVDVAIPNGVEGYQPLCATYSRACVPELTLRAHGRRLRLVDFVRETTALRIAELTADELAPFGDEATLFMNVNTPEDYARANALGQ
jgi:molybdopterin-guanine dinucleotide biosynthesis protein A